MIRFALSGAANRSLIGFQPLIGFKAVPVSYYFYLHILASTRVF